MGSPAARAPQRQRSTTPATPPPPLEARSAEDYWEIYVKKFIRDYQLDEAQRNSALAVLEDVRDKAARIRQKTEVDRKRTQTELQRLIKEKAPAGDIREWSRKRRELDVPISALFEELKSRLAKIPTEAQRRRVPDDYISKPPATRPSQPEAPTTQQTEKPAEEKQKTEQPKTAPAEKAKPAPPEKKPE